MAKQGQAGTKPAEGQEKERMDILQKYVSDMLAVEEHISSALQRQVNDENVVKHNSQASSTINNIAKMSEGHRQELEKHLTAIGGDAAKGLKDMATAALGTLAGLYDKVRNEAVSKMLRDDYTALNLAAVSYTMLHTVGLALNEERTASLAVRHLQEYAGILMEINEIIPSVVIADLRNDGTLVEERVVNQAVTNTQAAWQHHNGIHETSVANSQINSATPSKPRAATKKAAPSTSTSAGAAGKTASTKSKATTGDKTDSSKASTAASKPAASKSSSASKAPATSTKRTSAADKEKSSSSTN